MGLRSLQLQPRAGYCGHRHAQRQIQFSSHFIFLVESVFVIMLGLATCFIAPCGSFEYIRSHHFFSPAYSIKPGTAHAYCWFHDAAILKINVLGPPPLLFKKSQFVSRSSIADLCGVVGKVSEYLLNSNMFFHVLHI